MTVTLNHAYFAPLLGQTFAIEMEGAAAVALVLKHNTKRETAPSGYESFSLIFDGPVSPLLNQATYRLAHERAGSHDIFLVPVAGDEQGHQYEASFTIKTD